MLFVSTVNTSKIGQVSSHQGSHAVKKLTCHSFSAKVRLPKINMK